MKFESDPNSGIAEYADGARAILPIVPVIGVVGVVLGYTARAAGFSTLAAATMSATTFAGGAQFAAIAVLGSGGTVAAAVWSAAALNLRYAIMGAALAPASHGSLLRRLLTAHLTVDETWAVAYAGSGRFSRERLVGAGVVLLAIHVTATALGALARSALGDPHAWGLDAAFPALFLILLAPHLRERDGAFAALAGAAIALALTPVSQPGFPVLGAAAAAIVRAPRRSGEDTHS